MASMTILILDDDPDINAQHQLLCRWALRELRTEGLALDDGADNITSAYTLAAAQTVIDTGRVDCVLMDIALGSHEEGRSEAERRLLGDPGGIQLLRHIHQLPRQPLMLVISGEKLPSYYVDALSRYGVLAFYPKDDPNLPEKIRQAVKAVLWYRAALAHTDRQLQLQAWENALRAGHVAGIEPGRFPQQLGAQV
jgi:CheY-like chemotaxis protein